MLRHHSYFPTRHHCFWESEKKIISEEPQARCSWTSCWPLSPSPGPAAVSLMDTHRWHADILPHTPSTPSPGPTSGPRVYFSTDPRSWTFRATRELLPRVHCILGTWLTQELGKNWSPVEWIKKKSGRDKKQGPWGQIELVHILDLTLSCAMWSPAKNFSSLNPTFSLGKWERGLIISKSLSALAFESYF